MARILSFILLFTPMSTFAQIADGPNLGPLQDLMQNLLVVINQLLIPFIIGIGFLFFVWGMFLYFILGGGNDEKKEKGKGFMINAIIAFVVIIIFFGIINIITTSTGLQGETLKNPPQVLVP